MNHPVEINQSMYDLAGVWETYADLATRPRSLTDELGPGPDRIVQVERCRPCGEEIFATGKDGVCPEDVIRHLLNSHGYRMDGRRFDNQNNEVGRA